MARTLSKELLPPGATAWAWNGELYIPGDDGKARDMAGREVEVPADFPSDDELREQQKKANRFAPASAPLEQTIATGEHAEEKKPAKRSSRSRT